MALDTARKEQVGGGMLLSFLIYFFTSEYCPYIQLLSFAVLRIRPDPDLGRIRPCFGQKILIKQ